MPDFLLLIGTGGTLPETAAEEEASMARWDAWFTALGAALKDGGKPVLPATTRIEIDGSVSHADATVTGYTIVTADSLEAATEMAKGCPSLVRGFPVSVMETFAAS
jgi:hypothetical protein